MDGSIWDATDDDAGGDDAWATTTTTSTGDFGGAPHAIPTELRQDLRRHWNCRRIFCFTGLLGGALTVLIVLVVMGSRARERPAPVEPPTAAGLNKLGEYCGMHKNEQKGWCAEQLSCFGFKCIKCPCKKGVSCGLGSDTERRPVIKCDDDPCDDVSCKHGFCLNHKADTGSCVCKAAYSGSSCEIYNPCAEIKCGPHRHCVNSSHVCTPGTPL